MKRQQGIFIVFFAIVAAVLIAFFGLMFSSGFLASNKTQLQNVANNVALAAMEGYSSTRSGNFFLRSCVARTRAQRVLQENIVGGFSSLGELRIEEEQFQSRSAIANIQNEPHAERCSDGDNPASVDADADIEFGTWIEDRESDPLVVANDPGSGTPVCGGQYPCFVAATDENGPPVTASTQVSAVKFRVKTSQESALPIPFLNASREVTASSYGVVVPRCFAGVVDLSYSSVGETHPLPSSSSVFPDIADSPRASEPAAESSDPFADPLRTRLCPYTDVPLRLPTTFPGANNLNPCADPGSLSLEARRVCELARACDIYICQQLRASGSTVCDPENPVNAGKMVAQPATFLPRCVRTVNPNYMVCDGSEYFLYSTPRPATFQPTWSPRRTQWLHLSDAPGPERRSPYLGLPFFQLAALRRPSATTTPAYFPKEFMNEYTCGEADMASSEGGGYNFFERALWCNMWRGRGEGFEMAAPWFDVRATGPNNNPRPANFRYFTSFNRRSIPSFAMMWEYSNPFEYGNYTDSLTHRRSVKFWSDYDPRGFQTLYHNATAPAPDSVASPNEVEWVPFPYESPYGPLLVDKTVWRGDDGRLASVGPEPLSRYLSAMNAAFRLVSEQSSAGDRGLVLGFAGDLMYDADTPGFHAGGVSRQTAIIPGPRMPEFGGATPDMALLAQLTNPLGRGVYMWESGMGRYRNDAALVSSLGLPAGSFDEYHPNFIDAGLVARFSLDPNSRIGGTNILKALLQASRNLLNLNNGSGCGAGSLRSVVLFTDGINSCAPSAGAPSGSDWRDALLNQAPPGQRDWFACDARNPGVSAENRFRTFYGRYQDYLFGRGDFGSQVQTGLSEFFRQNRMTFSAVVDGGSVGAVWYPQRRQNPQPGQTEFLTYQEIRNSSTDVQMSVFPRRTADRFTREEVPGSDITNGATGYANTEGYVFRNVFETLGRFAFETGGVVWPILPRCQPLIGHGSNGCCAGDTGGESCYVSNQSGAELRDCAWNPTTRRTNQSTIYGDAALGGLTCSPLNLTESEQAAYVMISSIGQKPFSLRDPVSGDID